MRTGAWLVLDELNLASSEVLEALNRLLDDNRELVHPESTEVLIPHAHFRLFATQNPCGQMGYSGRKALSRAFRSRFLEIHVGEMTSSDLVQMLTQPHFALPENFVRRMIAVMEDLQRARSESHVLAGRFGFLTPRDLFRWAKRRPGTLQELAWHGMVLFGDRCRTETEREFVRSTLQRRCRPSHNSLRERNVYLEKNNGSPNSYFDLSDAALYDWNNWEVLRPHKESIEALPLGLTTSMRRILVLIGLCVLYRESILLVGDTGTGKTTACQAWCEILQRHLFTVNCHQNSDTFDLIGGLYPTHMEELQSGAESHRSESSTGNLNTSHPRFRWCDGPVTRAMRTGSMVLLDEINLAEQNVIERLNSVLDDSRSLILSERGYADATQPVDAHHDFLVMATMNPGGDFGKKELSDALKNRFTEIFVPPMTCPEDLDLAVKNILPDAALRDAFLQATWHDDIHQRPNMRDLMNFAKFISKSISLGISETESLHHGKVVFLKEEESSDDKLFWELSSALKVPQLPSSKKQQYVFDTPTTLKNLSNIMRAMLLPERAVLLEGAAGTGKTSLVETLSLSLTGRPVVRINLGEQTELSDLIGSFVPGRGEVTWCEGLLLQAVRNGTWILLDELNLASQTVLEGLNSLLDHRRSLFLPESCTSVSAHPEFRIFASQNPLQDGGGRKGLPRSFLSRFSIVQVQPLSSQDLWRVAESRNQHSGNFLPHVVVKFMAEVISRFHTLANTRSSDPHRSGLLSHASPVENMSLMEFNVRDLFRWMDLLIASLFPSKDRLKSACFTFSQDGHVTDIVHHIIHTAYCVLLQRLCTYESYSMYRESFFVAARMPDFVAWVSEHRTENGTLISQNSNEQWLSHTIDLCLRCARESALWEFHNGVVSHNRCFFSISNAKTSNNSALNGTTSVSTFVTPAQTTCKISPSLYLLSSQSPVLRTLIWCLQAGLHPVCLCGGPSSGKSTLVHIAARMCGAKLTQMHFTAGCDTAELLGGFHPTQEMGSRKSGFAWKDSLFLRAVQEGHWFLFENANLCSPTVLDRLNSLLEHGGRLIVNEQGVVDGKPCEIYPHQNFKLIMTMDPRNGILSRAMRNRSIEIFIPSIMTVEHEKVELKHPIDKNYGNIDPTEAHYTRESQFGQRVFRFNQNPDMHHILVNESKGTLSLSMIQRLRTLQEEIYGANGDPRPMIRAARLYALDKNGEIFITYLLNIFSNNIDPSSYPSCVVNASLRTGSPMPPIDHFKAYMDESNQDASDEIHIRKPYDLVSTLNEAYATQNNLSRVRANRTSSFFHPTISSLSILKGFLYFFDYFAPTRELRVKDSLTPKVSETAIRAWSIAIHLLKPCGVMHIYSVAPELPKALRVVCGIIFASIYGLATEEKNFFLDVPNTMRPLLDWLENLAYPYLRGAIPLGKTRQLLTEKSFRCMTQFSRCLSELSNHSITECLTLWNILHKELRHEAIDGLEKLNELGDGLALYLFPKLGISTTAIALTEKMRNTAEMATISFIPYGACCDRALHIPDIHLNSQSTMRTSECDSVFCDFYSWCNSMNHWSDLKVQHRISPSLWVTVAESFFLSVTEGQKISMGAFSSFLKTVNSLEKLSTNKDVDVLRNCLLNLSIPDIGDVTHFLTHRAFCGLVDDLFEANKNQKKDTEAVPEKDFSSWRDYILDMHGIDSPQFFESLCFTLIVFGYLFSWCYALPSVVGKFVKYEMHITRTQLALDQWSLLEESIGSVLVPPPCLELSLISDLVDLQKDQYRRDLTKYRSKQLKHVKFNFLEQLYGVMLNGMAHMLESVTPAISVLHRCLSDTKHSIITTKEFDYMRQQAGGILDVLDNESLLSHPSTRYFAAGIRLISHAGKVLVDRNESLLGVTAFPIFKNLVSFPIASHGNLSNTLETAIRQIIEKNQSINAIWIGLQTIATFIERTYLCQQPGHDGKELISLLNMYSNFWIQMKNTDIGEKLTSGIELRYYGGKQVDIDSTTYDSETLLEKIFPSFHSDIEFELQTRKESEEDNYAIFNDAFLVRDFQERLRMDMKKTRSKLGSGLRLPDFPRKVLLTYIESMRRKSYHLKVPEYASRVLHTNFDNHPTILPKTEIFEMAHDIWKTGFQCGLQWKHCTKSENVSLNEGNMSGILAGLLEASHTVLDPTERNPFTSRDNSKHKIDKIFSLEEPNPVEIVHITKEVLTPLRSKLQETILMDSDDEALLRVNRFINHIFEMPPLTTPVLKFVNTFEVLLKDYFEWSGARTKNEISVLDEHFKALKKVVSSMRQRELHNYEAMFVQMRLYEERNASLEFPVIRARIVQHGQDLPEDLSSTKEMYFYLREFLLGAPIGELSIRISLLHAVSSEISMMKEENVFCHSSIPVNDRFLQFASMIENTVHYVQGYQSHIEKLLSESYARRKAEIRSFAYGIVWKDDSFHALRDCTQKSQAALGRALHEFNTLLHQPVETQTAVSMDFSHDTSVASMWSTLRLSAEAAFNKDLESVSPNLEEAGFSSVQTNVSHILEILEECGGSLFMEKQLIQKQRLLKDLVLQMSEAEIDFVAQSHTDYRFREPWILFSQTPSTRNFQHLCLEPEKTCSTLWYSTYDILLRTIDVEESGFQRDVSTSQLRKITNISRTIFTCATLQRHSIESLCTAICYFLNGRNSVSEESTNTRNMTSLIDDLYNSIWRLHCTLIQMTSYESREWVVLSSEASMYKICSNVEVILRNLPCSNAESVQKWLEEVLKVKSALTEYLSYAKSSQKSDLLPYENCINSLSFHLGDIAELSGKLQNFFDSSGGAYLRQTCLKHQKKKLQKRAREDASVVEHELKLPTRAFDLHTYILEYTKLTFLECTECMCEKKNRWLRSAHSLVLQSLPIHHKTLKIALFWSTLALRLGTAGLSPTTTSDTQENSEIENMDVQDGTGMGSGEGKKDVTQELENEDQFLTSEDMKNESGEKPEKQDRDDEQKPIDATTNFEQEYESLNEDSENSSEQNSDIENEFGQSGNNTTNKDQINSDEGGASENESLAGSEEKQKEDSSTGPMQSEKDGNNEDMDISDFHKEKDDGFISQDEEAQSGSESGRAKSLENEAFSSLSEDGASEDVMQENSEMSCDDESDRDEKSEDATCGQNLDSEMEGSHDDTDEQDDVSSQPTDLTHETPPSDRTQGLGSSSTTNGSSTSGAKDTLENNQENNAHSLPEQTNITSDMPQESLDGTENVDFAQDNTGGSYGAVSRLDGQKKTENSSDSRKQNFPKGDKALPRLEPTSIPHVDILPELIKVEAQDAAKHENTADAHVLAEETNINAKLGAAAIQSQVQCEKLEETLRDVERQVKDMDPGIQKSVEEKENESKLNTNVRGIHSAGRKVLDAADALPDEKSANSADVSPGDLWSTLLQESAPLSTHLCEQLRCVLQPTKVDRLQGDYKTGKRLNIRRLIPYFASNYRRDKIWLRRTLPSKRQYQIALAVDDSYSMQANRVTRESLSCVALLAQALHRLEVGELAVLALGHDLTVCHSFESPFYLETTGVECLRKLTFAQRRTRFKTFLEQTLDYMDYHRARSATQTSRGSSRIVQLLFILSDGQITEDRSAIRELQCRAQSNEQIIVLLILDAPPSPSQSEATGETPASRASVLDMETVEFTPEGGVRRQPYLEDFPFAHYLVVRDMSHIPVILSQIIKQWFDAATQY